MSRLKFFAEPNEWIEILPREDSVAVYGRRFLDSGKPIGYFPLKEFTQDEYLREGFREVVVCQGPPPLSPQDWKYFNREEPNIIVFEKGRLKDGLLESATMRVLAKQSNVSELARRLKKEIIALRGSFGFTDPIGERYDDIFVSKRAAQHSLHLV